jgi:hypothetical protein
MSISPYQVITPNSWFTVNLLKFSNSANLPKIPPFLMKRVKSTIPDLPSANHIFKKPNAERIVFLYAFAKNARANISDKEKEALSLVAEAFVSATEAQVGLLLKAGSIVEVQHHE